MSNAQFDPNTVKAVYVQIEFTPNDGPINYYTCMNDASEDEQRSLTYADLLKSMPEAARARFEKVTPRQPDEYSYENEGVAEVVMTPAEYAELASYWVLEADQSIDRWDDPECAELYFECEGMGWSVGGATYVAHARVTVSEGVEEFLTKS